MPMVYYIRKHGCVLRARFGPKRGSFTRPADGWCRSRGSRLGPRRGQGRELEIEVFGIGAEALAAVELVENGDVGRAELEVEESGVFRDVLERRRARDGDDLVLQIPVQDNLGGSFAVLLGDFDDFGDLVDVALHEGRPSLTDDAAFTAGGGERGLEEIGVKLDLIDHRYHGDAGLDKRVEVVREVVAHADGAGLALVVKLFERLPCLAVFSDNGPVQQEQIDLAESETFEGFVARLDDCGTTLPDGVVPDFGGHEYLAARKAAVADGLADTAFVFVDGGGVDVAITNLQGGADRLLNLRAVLEFPSAKAEKGNVSAAVELNGVADVEGHAVDGPTARAVVPMTAKKKRPSVEGFFASRESG